MSTQPEWFKDWFNSSYYHSLYQHRNDAEAALFIDNLIEHLQLAPQSHIWDLACGKGRHAKHIASKGFQVIGTDLAENSILEAQKNSPDNLEFFVHDMRRPFRINYFEAVTNLFTSIGYFKNYNDNYKVFESVHQSLKPNGLFVIDFFNAECIKQQLTHTATLERGELTFHITKRIENNTIIKTISFSDKGKDYYFEEFVSLLDLEAFKALAKASSFTLKHTFGNYQLEQFDVNKSDRLILVFQK